MNTVSHESSCKEVERPLERAGFLRHHEDGTYRRRVEHPDHVIPDEFVARWEWHWLTIETGPRADADRAGEVDLAEAGPWRSLPARDGSTRRVFDLPEAAWTAELSADDGAASDAGSGLDACLRWAIESERCAPDDIWAPPSSEQVDDLVPRSATTVRVGEIVRECDVHLECGRFALRCPIVPALPADLLEPRREWLERLAAETQLLWRMVRVGTEGAAFIAVVDLTGAPAGALPGLVNAALASLRGSVAWAAKPAAAIVSDIESSILDASPRQLNTRITTPQVARSKRSLECATSTKETVSPR